MNEMQCFVFEGRDIRTVSVDGEPWFVARDVCMTLEIDTSTAVNGQLRDDGDGYRVRSGGLDDDEKAAHIVSTPGGNQQVLIVSEPGLYSLIMKSRKPEAKEFKRWLTHVVIPSIRKTGSYSVQQPQSIEDLIILQAQSMKDLRNQVDSLNIQLQVATHRINSIDNVDVIGDKQQRLGAMVRKLAQQNGWTFQHAWREFTGAFNRAYRTNLTQRIDHYKEKHSLKDLSRPQYLSMVDQLDDAIRVADKMLNRVPVGV